MGIIYVEGTVRGPAGAEEQVNFLVDSGAGYSLLPRSAWESIGLQPNREETFILADGTRVVRRMSECYLILPQGESHTPVILGEPGESHTPVILGEPGDDQALLGVVSLEVLGLVLNPFSRTLHPMRLLL
jgi:predicted aspartyl protease